MNGGTMFTITSTRIVGLIAVVCAAIVAPQALAATSTHRQDRPPVTRPTTRVYLAVRPPVSTVPERCHPEV